MDMYVALAEHKELANADNGHPFALNPRQTKIQSNGVSSSVTVYILILDDISSCAKTNCCFHVFRRHMMGRVGICVSL